MYAPIKYDDIIIWTHWLAVIHKATKAKGVVVCCVSITYRATLLAIVAVEFTCLTDATK